MLKDETVRKLSQISTPKTFKANEYICYEGQPGNAMYIVLRGVVGVYVSNVASAQTEVARIMAGDFFGEMSLFDNLPRSASCIALEDVICIEIGKDKLVDFFGACPNMAMMMLENMSGRIRRLDNELYKSEKYLQKEPVLPFEIPEPYNFSHIVEEPPHDRAFMEIVSTTCPICGKSINSVSLKKHIMSIRKVDGDGRVKYKECDPLWYDIWSCPYCHYSNHYQHFFHVLEFKKEIIHKLIKEKQNPQLLKATFMKTPFDHLFLKYIQAIHINQVTNSSDIVLIGKLWLNLYWLFDDAADDIMKNYCAEKAIYFLEKSVNENKITDAYSKQSFMVTLANLYAESGKYDEARRMCRLSAEGEDSQLRVLALRLKGKLSF